jgi:hypothetical protein
MVSASPYESGAVVRSHCVEAIMNSRSMDDLSDVLMMREEKKEGENELKEQYK